MYIYSIKSQSPSKWQAKRRIQTALLCSCTAYCSWDHLTARSPRIRRFLGQTVQWLSNLTALPWSPSSSPPLPQTIKQSVLPYSGYATSRIPIATVAPRGGRGTYIWDRLYISHTLRHTYSSVKVFSISQKILHMTSSAQIVKRIFLLN